MTRPARLIVLVIALCAVAWQIGATASAASTVRGQVYRTIKGQKAPASGIAVRLNHPKQGPSSYVYTNSEGMYYLYNVPAGSYTLEVSVTSKKIQKYSIKVLDQPYTDIAPVQIQ